MLPKVDEYRYGRGYLISLDRRYATLLNDKSHAVKKYFKCEDEELVLGQFYFRDHFRYMKRPSSSNLDIWIVDRAVYINTYVMLPAENVLPQYIYDKFQNQIWSPQCGFVEDPKGLYLKNCVRGDRLDVTVTYQAAKFVITNILNDQHEKRLQLDRIPPWDWELKMEEAPKEEKLIQNPHPETMVYNDRQKHRLIGPGLCIAEDAINPRYTRGVPGSKTHCHELFSSRGGLTRWFPHNKDKKAIKKVFRREFDSESFIGNWYTYKLNDSNKTNPSIYDSTTAKDLVQVPAPLMTRVNQGVVTVITQFDHSLDVFRDKDGEFTWSKDIKMRTNNFRFWDDHLGYVDLNDEHVRRIIKYVRCYLKTLGRSTSVASEEITTRVIVGLKSNYHQLARRYPREGLFEVVSVEQIKLKDRNQVIFGDLYD